MDRFELSKKEKKAAKKFIKKQEKKDRSPMTTIGGRFQYIFTPTGVGVCISIFDALLKKKKDITDYSCW